MFFSWVGRVSKAWNTTDFPNPVGRFTKTSLFESKTNRKASSWCLLRLSNPKTSHTFLHELPESSAFFNTHLRELLALFLRATSSDMQGEMWLVCKSWRHRNRSCGSSLQTLSSVETSDSRKYVCIYRLLEDQPCWIRFLAWEKLSPSRNGRMEWNFPVIPIFRKRGCTQNVFLNFRKLFPEFLPFHSVSDRKSRNFWPNGKRPWQGKCTLVFNCLFSYLLLYPGYQSLFSRAANENTSLRFGGRKPRHERRICGFRHRKPHKKNLWHPGYFYP